LYGASGTGKSTLASQFERETVYETDRNSTIPDLTYYSVIVVGNKYQDHLQQVIELVKSAEIHRQMILVNFSFG
jgi:GTPase SAR1 family protein